MKNKLLIFFLAGVFGCEIPDKGLIESSAPPFLSQSTVVPSSLNVNEVAILPTDPIDTVLQCTVSASNIDNGTQVYFTLHDPLGNALANGTLLDDGSAADQKTGDGVFATNVHFKILKRDLGSYTIQFQATDRSGFRSNTIFQTIVVKNSNNHRPTIANPIVPDTVAVPNSSDTTFVKVSITVLDQDGLDDIASVSFTSRRPDLSVVAVYPLYDDGGTTPRFPFGLKSGDVLAGDGVFTLTFPLTSSTQGGTYRDFSFVATDKSGESSSVITRRIFIR